MIKRYRKRIIGLVVLAFIAVFVWDTVRQPGPADLRGGFEEIAFVRNEQNKGGIVRVYAFRVADTVGADYLGCGELLPHNDYGSTTTAYFFAAGAPTPSSLQLEAPHFDMVQFRPIAVYRKAEDGVGRVELVDQSMERFIHDVDLNSTVALNNGRTGSQQYVTAFAIFTHVITHEFHHKGQILSRSRQLGYTRVDMEGNPYRRRLKTVRALSRPHAVDPPR